jgi:lipoprotein NlpD
VRQLRILVPAFASALLAACASSSYRAPVVERNVTRPAAAKVAPPAIEQKPESYTVKPGDTLYSIALSNSVDYRELAAWNGISDPSVLKPGAVLRLRPQAAQQPLQPEARAPAQPATAVQVQPMVTPGAVEARSLGGEQRVAGEPQRATVEPRAGPAEVARPDLLKTGPKAMKLPYSEENVALLLRLSPPEPKVEATAAPNASAQSGDVDWMWPASGRVLAGFSKGTNKGVDILGKLGDPVLASASGRVTYIGTVRGYGKLVIIKHNDTYLSAYAHNRSVLVKEGQTVTKGQKIAEIGNTDSTQVKLHFEIRRLGEPVDPLKFLPERRS